MPAYAVVQGLIKQMLSKPEELLKTLTIILERHPALVNSHDPRTGSSLLQMVTENCNVTQVLERTPTLTLTLTLLTLLGEFVPHITLSYDVGSQVESTAPL